MSTVSRPVLSITALKPMNEFARGSLSGREALITAASSMLLRYSAAAESGHEEGGDSALPAGGACFKQEQDAQKSHNRWKARSALLPPLLPACVCILSRGTSPVSARSILRQNKKQTLARARGGSRQESALSSPHQGEPSFSPGTAINLRHQERTKILSPVRAGVGRIYPSIHLCRELSRQSGCRLGSGAGRVACS